MTLNTFYRIAARLFLFTVGLLTILNVMLALGGRETLENLPFLFRLPLGTLGVLSAIGIVTLWFGMMWNCVVVSSLPLSSKIRWILLLIVTNMLGTLIYYFVVFQRQPQFPSRSTAR